MKKYVIEDQEAVDSYLTTLGGGHFSDTATGGDYASSVSSIPYCKNIGIRGLLGAVSPAPGADVFDMLGGSGQVALAAQQYGLCSFADAIITADIEIDQVERALRRGLRAVPLDLADPRIIRNSSVHHLLYAYGFHHLSPDARASAAREAYRILKPGGTAVFYDGTIGTTTERISSLVVDRLSDHPHKYPHPTVDEIEAAAEAAGLELRGTFRILDPQIFLSATGSQARQLAAQYYADHYAIDSLSWELLHDHLTDAYRSSNPIDAPEMSTGRQELAGWLPWNETYSGPTSAKLLQAIFPCGWDTPDESCRECVVIPREGVAVIYNKPQ
ncbi:class I SAM-dependent methyltransferase [Actinomadura craniellae]|uniref:class I SAM-dependent methyltransferase n=1 Tax=Actinomadura craniellae TaxID=2231787 RepID=UPI00131480A9|nr:class I SAM-dependent methyltransferase [Actinomadura craniellae]